VKVASRGDKGEARERAFLHYRHVRGLITGTRGVIFSPLFLVFAAFFRGLGTTSRSAHAVRDATRGSSPLDEQRVTRGREIEKRASKGVRVWCGRATRGPRG